MSPSHCSFPLRAPHYRGAGTTDDNVPLDCDDGSQGLFSRSMLAFNRGAAEDAKTLECYDGRRAIVVNTFLSRSQEAGKISGM